MFLILTIYYGYVTYKYLTTEPIRLLYLFGYLISRFIEPTEPFLNVDKFFPNHKLFINSANFTQIKKEILCILPHRHLIPLTKNTFGTENEYIGSDIDGLQKDTEDGWRIFVVSVGKRITSGGLQNFPTICNLVKQCPEVLSCIVSILPSNKGIPIHVGYYKGFIRYQLGIVVPKDNKNCFLCVNGEKYVWESGKDMMFDDTFPHKVYNMTEETRVVLYMDIERKFLPKWLEKLNRFAIGLFQESEEIKKEIKKTEYQILLNDKK